MNAEFYEGKCYSVSGKISGSDSNEEVMMCGHLYEPGANDNASGCGMVLAIADVLRRSIDKGLIPKPKRSIRFVMGFECSGLMGYSHFYPNRLNKTVGLLNADMTGAAGIENAKLHIWHNPLSNYSYMDILLPALLEEYLNFTGERFDYEEQAYSIVDNLLADPSINVPTISMIMHPSVSYHSSLDNLTRVDGNVLKRNGIVAGTFLFFLASPCSRNKEWLFQKIDDYVEETVEKLSKESDVKRNIMNEVIEKAVLRYVLDFDENCSKLKKLSSFIYNSGVDLDKKWLTDITNEAVVEQAEKITPVRNVKGPLTFLTMDENIRNKIPWNPFYNYHLNCSLYWVDGKKNLLDIYIRTVFELGVDYSKTFLEDLLAYYNFLCKHKYIYINRS